MLSQVKRLFLLVATIYCTFIPYLRPTLHAGDFGFDEAHVRRAAAPLREGAPELLGNRAQQLELLGPRDLRTAYPLQRRRLRFCAGFCLKFRQISSLD